jgi:putative acetyltransferase
MKTAPFNLTIRAFQLGDEEAVLRVHWDAVHELAAADYDATVLDAWSGPVDAERICRFAKSRVEHPDVEVILVAELSGQIVGFGSIVPHLSELRAVYVSPRATRRGVGRKILLELERLARERGICTLHLDSSVTAENFYRVNGYQTAGRDEHMLANGRLMRCVKMQKWI